MLPNLNAKVDGSRRSSAAKPSPDIATSLAPDPVMALPFHYLLQSNPESTVYKSHLQPLE